MRVRKSILFLVSDVFAKPVCQSRFVGGMVLLKTSEDSEVKFKVCAGEKRKKSSCC
jgi:hypothetical protein